MAEALTTSKFIKSVKRRGAIPESQVTFSEDDFLDIANEEMDNSLIPTMLMYHEEYFVDRKDVPLVANQTEYEIPYRAIGNKLRDVFYKDDQGNIFEMTRVSPENRFINSSMSASGDFTRFFMEGAKIVLLGSAPATTSSLEMVYFLRPNRLVKENRTAKVTAIDTVTGVITLDSAPSVFAVSLEYDVIQAKSPHDIRTYDIVASAYSNTNKTLTFDPDDLPLGLVVGDYICLAGETPIPNVPTELHSMLAQRVTCRCLESMGHTEGLNLANAKLAEMQQSLGTLIDNRVTGAPQKVVNTNSMLLNRNLRRGW